MEKLGFENVPTYIYPYSDLEIETNEEWLEHKEQTEGFIKNIIKKLEDNTLHIFPLSQIPLLINIGFLLGNGNSNMKIYQFNYEDNWVLDSDTASEVNIYHEYIKRKHAKKLLVIFEISSSINIDDINVVQDVKLNSIIRIYIDDPKRGKVLYSSQVKQVKKYFFDQMENYYSKYDEIHFFYSGPAGLAVELGRCIQKNMWPKVFLYHYRRNSNPKYKFAFVINE